MPSLETSSARALSGYVDVRQWTHLPPFVVDGIRDLVEAKKDRVFHMFKDRFQVNTALRTVCEAAKIEYLSTHKVGSHTFATNLNRLAGMDAKGMTETGRWKDPKSTHHYTHYLKREQAGKADSLSALLPKEKE